MSKNVQLQFLCPSHSISISSYSYGSYPRYSYPPPHTTTSVTNYFNVCIFGLLQTYAWPNWCKQRGPEIDQNPGRSKVISAQYDRITRVPPVFGSNVVRRAGRLYFSKHQLLARTAWNNRTEPLASETHRDTLIARSRCAFTDGSELKFRFCRFPVIFQPCGSTRNKPKSKFRPFFFLQNILVHNNVCNNS